MRKYQPIWERIKKDFTATVRSALPMHNRIIEAVRKEKKIDYVWKLEVADNHKRYKLINSIDGELIIFQLEEITVLDIQAF